jgi:hypothetical protein
MRGGEEEDTKKARMMNEEWTAKTLGENTYVAHYGY